MNQPCFQYVAPVLPSTASSHSATPRTSSRPSRTQAFAFRPRLSMSLSTPTPPTQPFREPPSGPSPPSDLVTELTYAAALQEHLDRLAGETFVSVGEDGDVRERPLLVLVEAYSKSCRACIGVKRVYQKIAEQHKGALRCFRFDAFNCGNLAQKLGVRGLPTFVLYKRKEVEGVDGQLQFEWKRIDHFSTTKRSVLEQMVIDNM